MVEYQAFVEQDFMRPRALSFNGAALMLFTARAPGRDAPNEDAAAVVRYGDGSGVLIVADGLGGAPAGHEAARLSVENIAKSVRDARRRQQPLRDGILDGIERANEAIVALGVGAATTLAAVEVQDGRCRAYHVGDSMILITGQRGRVKFRTIPHSPVGYAVEAGMLDEIAAATHAQRHVVSNVLGSSRMHIDIGPTVKLSNRDTVIIASDGVSDNLYDSQIVELIRKGPLNHCASELMEACRKRMGERISERPGKPDDTTFVLFRPRCED